MRKLAFVVLFVLPAFATSLAQAQVEFSASEKHISQPPAERSLSFSLILPVTFLPTPHTCQLRRLVLTHCLGWEFIWT